MIEIQHDHTQLDVLFEDLLVVGRQAFATGGELELIEDARAQWSDLQEEIAGHFGKEERKVFAPLASRYPEQAETIQTLFQQHQALRRQLGEVEQMMRGSPEEMASRRQEFEKRWAEFASLWKTHSEVEWKLIQAVREQMEQAARSGGEGQP